MRARAYSAGEDAAVAFYKLARVTTELKPHQKRVLEKLKAEDQPGLVVAHGLGSGKTLTAIAAQDALGLPADVVVPAALQANFKKELRKHRKGGPKAEIKSLQNLARKGQAPTAPMLIVDEAHRAREPGAKTYQALKKTEAEKRLLLTGTPFYNHPADIAPLINLAAGGSLLPVQRPDFERRYVLDLSVSPGIMGWLRGAKAGATPVLNPARKKELRDVFGKWVDYHPGSSEGFPEVMREDVRVPMTAEQQQVYDSLMGEAPAWVSYKVRAGLPPSKQESKQLNAFLGAARQVVNTTGPFKTQGAAQEPKIQAAFEALQKTLKDNPRAKAVVYSNFLSAGVNPYRQRLEGAGIPYGEFTGEMPKAERDALVRQYNEGKLRALLLSSAGGEGLDLKGTRLLQVLEPHWNDEKLRQVEGRAARYLSHAGLPEDERNVRIQRYLATRAPSGVLEKLRLRKPGYAVDEYLGQLAKQKEDLNAQFRDLFER
jgi:SNF2 family DNA or RNA helicase